MNEAEHRKQLLIQRIADHRDLLCREMDVIRETNPLTSAIGSARRILGLARSFSPRGLRDRAAGATGSSPVDVELVTTALPAVLRILRAVLRRHQRERASRKPT